MATELLKKPLVVTFGTLGVFIALTLLLTALDRFVVINHLTDPVFDGELEQVPSGTEKVVGVHFVSTLINLLDTEMDRPLGGYRPDNVVWYGKVMPFDNVKNFQIGVVEMCQRTALFMKERVSRTGGGSDEFNRNLTIAAESLNYKKETVILTGMQFNDALDRLADYRRALVDRKAAFVNNTESLYAFLSMLREVMGDTHRNLTKWEEKDGSPISASDVDDYYYQAMGQSYAVLALMRAVEVEYKTILTERGCMPHFAEMKASLEHATNYNPPWVILDGDINAQFWPNHRSNLETSVNDARFKIITVMESINR